MMRFIPVILPSLNLALEKNSALINVFLRKIIKIMMFLLAEMK